MNRYGDKCPEANRTVALAQSIIGLVRYADAFADFADLYSLTQHNIRFTKLVNNVPGLYRFLGMVQISFLWVLAT